MAVTGSVVKEGVDLNSHSLFPDRSIVHFGFQATGQVALSISLIVISCVFLSPFLPPLVTESKKVNPLDPVPTGKPLVIPHETVFSKLIAQAAHSSHLMLVLAVTSGIDERGPHQTVFVTIHPVKSGLSAIVASMVAS
ncbi:hypothetical protein KBB05_01260 [Patescibacteria group bacterium]|nr:hypothetical protein [Patescibacteria group bacterium]